MCNSDRPLRPADRRQPPSPGAKHRTQEPARSPPPSATPASPSRNRGVPSPHEAAQGPSSPHTHAEGALKRTSSPPPSPREAWWDRLSRRQGTPRQQRGSNETEVSPADTEVSPGQRRQATPHQQRTSPRPPLSSSSAAAAAVPARNLMCHRNSDDNDTTAAADNGQSLTPGNTHRARGSAEPKGRTSTSPSPLQPQVYEYVCVSVYT